MEFKATIVSWNDIERWTIAIKKKILASDFRPDVIIGIARGGLVPARLISDYLFIKEMLSIRTEHWGITANIDGEAVLKDKLSSTLENKKVLIVDDITDTGQSMKLSRDYVKSLGPVDVKTATMLHIENPSYKPDFFGEDIRRDKWSWFIFPWNIYEDVYNLSKNIIDAPMGINIIEQKLRENYGLETEKINLNEIFKDYVEMKIIRNDSGKYYL
ncbi:phosphoribosyltransferase [Picrophilus oshimae]|uniref:Xanthine-guanine phosphoribosyltransferase n=1 Tax=Picrophilus torridus (strain ATCC 700027 / DSM 9790 / JCM 10055 / NBRC 100828 / KAW 2/3) TaxID=1122961 RepID=Q6L1H8_PICTO|nr:phosphoribosyltransferase [Picrophilus oshimae]AAT43174.1 xanthine-guanine phosphoribosyltransferase [Picrophilus oshimae DSM 9789]